MDGDRVTILDHVEAPLTYLIATGERPVAYQYEPPPGVPVRSGKYADHRMTIRNARPLLAHLSLDREGVVLTQHPTDFTAFDDDEVVKSIYYRQAEELVKHATGAVRVVAFDHNVRSAPRSGRGDRGVREPVRRVHND